MFFITVTTPDRDFHMILDEDDIVLASGFGDIDDLIARLPENLQNHEDLREKNLLHDGLHERKNHRYSQYIAAYYNGDQLALNKIPRKVTGTSFQKDIWKTMSKIPYGKAISYLQLAKNVGHPNAVRAAGTACGQNRLTLLIPCHRIIKSNGEIGSYYYGDKIKRSLLSHEEAI